MKNQILEEVSTVLQGHDKFVSMYTKTVFERGKSSYYDVCIRYADLLQKRVSNLLGQKRISKGLKQLLQKIQKDVYRKTTLVEAMKNVFA